MSRGLGDVYKRQGSTPDAACRHNTLFVTKRETDRIVKNVYSAKFKRCETALLRYRQRLHSIIVNYKPTDEVTDFSDKYTEAVKKIDTVDYFCDAMANGTFEEKRDLIYTKEVRNIERMFKQ